MLEGHGAPVHAIAQSRLNSDVLFTVCKDGVLRSYELQKGTLHFSATPQEPTDGLYSIALSPSEDYVFVGTGQGSVLAFNINLNKWEFAFDNGHSDIVTSIVISNDGKFLYSSSFDGRIVQWDLAAKA